MDIKEVLLPWFTKGSSVATLANKSAFNNEQLAEQLHKPIIKYF